MKKLKRDPLEKAFVRGYTKGLCGKSRELCPSHLVPTRHAWLSGWSEGRKAKWDGLTGTAGLEQLSQFQVLSS
ncbi:UNVERIFIED_CONTAM: hypothetical protein GTU68_029918 [Idotea baltica]|nr:hypothetical protein [Idotea baltica]